MNDMQRINDEVFPEAFALLPSKMDSLAARAMVLAIGLQESRFQHRVQIGGPAHGYYQFEQGGGCAGVIRHASVAAITRKVCAARAIPVSAQSIYANIVNDDVLATGCARLLLYTLPDALPAQNQREEGGRQYSEAWRPGMPHRHTWDAFFDLGWRTVID